MINTFLAVVAHPWDQLLDKEKLKELKFESGAFKECGFPVFPSLPVEGKQPEVGDAHELLRLLRNGMAHGNMEILDLKTLRRLRQRGPLPRVKESEIAGLRIWNRLPDTMAVTWCTALDIYELRRALDGMMQLCQKRSLWQEDVRVLQDQRDAERRARRAS
ncbi:MAG: hypothetical protein H0U10_13395 [Chloroflexia bacterium]|nr:hypothetical protein [Chloroflexia bacterium]